MMPITEFTVGSHRIVREAEDVIALHFAASPTEGEMNDMMNVQAEITGGRPTFLIIDLRHVDTMSSGARRVVGESSKRMSFKGFIMYGASFQMKVVAKLLNSALALLSKSNIPQEFVDDHQAARAWIERHRRQPAAGA